MRAPRASDARDHALFALLPVIATIWLAHNVFAGGIVGVDFNNEYWVAGSRLISGGELYSWSRLSIASGVAFPYPAATAVLFVPFAALPRIVADTLFLAICMVSIVATLRVLNVRDWRVYGISFLSCPVVNAWQTGNLTLILALGLALIWRYRDRPVVAGVLAALIISLKPFVWPVALWLLATRRYAAAAYCVAVGLVTSGAAWAIVGFGQISRYLHLAGEVTNALYRGGYGIVSIAYRIGVSHASATIAEIVLAAAVAIAMLVLARRGREQVAFTACVVMMLIASPLLWNHYFAILLVPMAIARPRLGAVWVAPLILWACPAEGVANWQVALAWLVAGGVVLAIVCQPSPRASASSPVASS
jgi:hypothetical protein